MENKIISPQTHYLKDDALLTFGEPHSRHFYKNTYRERDGWVGDNLDGWMRGWAEGSNRPTLYMIFLKDIMYC